MSNFAKLSGIFAVTAALLSPLPAMACAGQLSQAGLYAATVAISATVAAAGLALTHKRTERAAGAAAAV